MFVLSAVRAPENGAAFGKSTVYKPVDAAEIRRRIENIIMGAGSTRSSAQVQAETVLSAPDGWEFEDPATGFTYRVDPADNPPNVCPCCGGLVRPDDHASAGTEDAYCLGCFTWKRDVPQCLPENSAHPVGYDPDKDY